MQSVEIIFYDKDERVRYIHIVPVKHTKKGKFSAITQYALDEALDLDRKCKVELKIITKEV